MAIDFDSNGRLLFIQINGGQGQQIYLNSPRIRNLLHFNQLQTTIIQLHDCHTRGHLSIKHAILSSTISMGYYRANFIAFA